MKKFNHFLFFYLIWNFSVQAQYQSVIDTNGTSWQRGVCIGIDACGKDSSYYLHNHDTLIGSRVFKTIEVVGFSSDTSRFFLAEDTTGELWYKASDSTQDTSAVKIMDMNLTVGDTFKIFNTYPVVDSVYRKNGKKHIRFDTLIRSSAFEKSYHFAMIEGVGTNFFGVDYNVYSSLTFMDTANPVLICQKKSGILNYNNPIDSSTKNCNIILTDLPSIVLNELGFTIYPNPAKEELLIETENKLPIQQIELYDLSGRRQQIWEGKSGENKYRLSLENLQTGLYFIVLRLKNGERITKKLLKE